MGTYITVMLVLTVLSMLVTAVRIFLRQGLIAKVSGLCIAGLGFYVAVLAVQIISRVSV
jgi:hypothetical protein